jgi:hypothetical protein
MKKWSITSMCADFEGFLDKVSNEGPQIIRRRKIDFVCLNTTDFEARMGKDYKIASGNTHDFSDFVAKPRAHARHE